MADQRRQPSNPFDEPETYVDNNVSIDDMRRQQQQIIRGIFFILLFCIIIMLHYSKLPIAVRFVLL